MILKDGLKLAKYFFPKCDVIEILPKDASSRIYFRLKLLNQSYIMVYFTNNKECDIKLFTSRTNLLNKYKINSPMIIKKNLSKNILLLNDLGNVSFKKYILYYLDNNKIIENYKNVIDLLIEIQNIPIVEIKNHYTIEHLLESLKLFTTYYTKYSNTKLSLDFEDLCHSISLYINKSSIVPVHRDFHSENIMISNGKLTIIDYQDLSIGSPYYDLVSLLQDARINVTNEVEEEVISYFCKRKKLLQKDIKNDYDIIGFQNNLRILGIFAYHALNNNFNYVKYIPRVLNYLKKNLSNPILDRIKNSLVKSNIIQ